MNGRKLLLCMTVTLVLTLMIIGAHEWGLHLGYEEGYSAGVDSVVCSDCPLNTNEGDIGAVFHEGRIYFFLWDSEWVLKKVLDNPPPGGFTLDTIPKELLE